MFPLVIVNGPSQDRKGLTHEHATELTDASMTIKMAMGAMW